ALLLAPLCIGSARAESGGMQAARAQDLLNGFGINTHLDGCCNGNGGNYNDTDAVIRAIRYIGKVKLLRDFCESDKLLRIAPRVTAATGAHFWCAIGETRPKGYPEQLELMRRGHRDHWVVAYEGPNEPDAPYVGSLGGPFLRQAAAFMPTLHRAAQQDGVAAIQTSFGVVWPHSDYGTTGDLAADADYGNAHVYPQACPNCLGAGNKGAIAWMDREARKTTPGKPVAISEWGYTTPAHAGYGAVSEAAQAAYALEFILDAHQAGDPYYIYYGLLNDGSGNFGLFHNDFMPKKSAVALHDLFALLHDPSPRATSFTPGRLDVHLHGMPRAEANAGGRSALFQQADGIFWLALWNEQILNDYRGDNHDVHVAPVPVRVSFDRPVESITEYDPVDHGTAPLASGKGSSFALQLPAHPVLLRIDRK
ncbi:MAG TPA: hypothetical protein VFN42_01415, partial [Acetobacteraceae bacterium]|nr:hypothetical protein [Acetobacteraceae bacterium]